MGVSHSVYLMAVGEFGLDGTIFLSICWVM